MDLTNKKNEIYEKNVLTASEIFAEYGNFIRTVINYHVKNEHQADDLFQDFFLSLVYRPIPDSVDNIKSYLYRAICNDIVDNQRQLERYNAQIKKYQERCNFAINNTERLLLIINDILDIEKIESGKLAYKFKIIKLMPLIEQAISANTGYAMHYGVRLQITDRMDDAYVSADPDRLMQVLNNVTSNAIKFSSEGGRVELGVRACGSRGEAARGRMRKPKEDFDAGWDHDFLCASSSFASSLAY